MTIHAARLNVILSAHTDPVNLLNDLSHEYLRMSPEDRDGFAMAMAAHLAGEVARLRVARRGAK